VPRAGRSTLLALALVLVVAGMAVPASAGPGSKSKTGDHRATPPQQKSPASHACWDRSTPDPLEGLPASNADCQRLLSIAYQVIDLSTVSAAGSTGGNTVNSTELDDTLSHTDSLHSPQGHKSLEHLQKIFADWKTRQQSPGSGPSISPGQGSNGDEKGRPRPATLRLSLDNLQLIAAFFALAVSLLTMSMEFLNRKDGSRRAGQLKEVISDVATEKDSRCKDVDHLTRCHQQLKERVDSQADVIELLRRAVPTGGFTNGDGEAPTQRYLKKNATPDPALGDESSQLPDYFDGSVAPRPNALPPATRAGGDGFLGTVANLLPRAPAGSRTMRYDTAAKLLIDGPADFWFTVFADPETRDMRVLPNMPRASVRTELWGFEALFDVDGTGPGAISVTQHPHLEEVGMAFRVLDKGRLRLG
jgi:hypothetical protein